LLLSVVPLKTPKPLDIAAIEKRRPVEFLQMGGGGFSYEGFGTRLICHDGPRNRKEAPSSVVELNDDGSVHAGRRMLIWAGRMNNKDVANLEIYERDMMRSLSWYVKLLRAEGVFGPLDVRVILDGMADAFISHVKPDRWPQANVRPVRDGTEGRGR
jgi:hypothetical protein